MKKLTSTTKHIIVLSFLCFISLYGKAQADKYYKLQSNPGAPVVFYLNLKGEVLTDAEKWNMSYSETRDTIVATKPSFTGKEIEGIFNIVADDFSPFTVNITTDREVYEATPKLNRIMVIFTPNQEWRNQAPVNGVANWGSYNKDDVKRKVVWVFADEYEKAGNTASHEIGHSLGCDHQRKFVMGNIIEYHTGFTKWAPIMGKPKKIQQWANGKYKDAYEHNGNDIGTIVGAHSISFRKDDHANKSEGATAITIVDNVFDMPETAGLIEKRSDVDYFKFTSEGGKLQLGVYPPQFADILGANLKAQIRLFDTENKLVATSKSVDPLEMGAYLETPIDAGEYYIEIDGIGEGDPYVDGFSDYGSIGEYRFEGEIIPIAEIGDVNLVKIYNSIAPFCGKSFAPKVKVENLGSAVTSLDFTIYANGELVGNHHWTGNIVSYGCKNITLSPFTVDESYTTFSIEVVKVNGADDADISNNTAEKAFTKNYSAFPYVEKFLEEQINKNNWTVTGFNGDNKGFAIKKYATPAKSPMDFNDRHSVIFDNIQNKTDGDRLISQAFDMSELQAAELSFNLIMTYKNGKSDGLKILYSTDCGETWVEYWNKTGLELKLRERGIMDHPLSASDWSKIKIKLSNDIVGQKNIQFAFESIDNSYGYTYLDDIKIRKMEPVEDCNFELNGFAELNECDVCVGGSTGFEVIDEDGNGIADCLNIPISEQTISLQEGWNLISLNVAPTNTAPAQLFPNAAVIKTFDAFYAKESSDAFNSLNEIKAGEAYLIKNEIDEDITVQGTEPETTKIELKAGWNLVGVLGQKEFILTDIPEEIEIVKDFDGFYKKDGALNSLQQLETGKAYFIKATGNCIINY